MHTSTAVEPVNVLCSCLFLFLTEGGSNQIAKAEKIIKQLAVGSWLLFSFQFSFADLFHSLLYQGPMKSCEQRVQAVARRLGKSLRP